MRERNSIWDILTVALLAILIVINAIMLLQNDRAYVRINELSDAVSKINTGSSNSNGAERTQNPNIDKNEPITALTGTLFDGSDQPKAVHGDEKAEDGD